MSDHTPPAYRVEFGPAWPVPPITVDFKLRADTSVLTRCDLHYTPKLENH